MQEKGKNTITENIFENRFMHVSELIRMGVKAKIKGKSIICYGIKNYFLLQFKKLIYVHLPV